MWSARSHVLPGFGRRACLSQIAHKLSPAAQTADATDMETFSDTASSSSDMAYVSPKALQMAEDAELEEDTERAIRLSLEDMGIMADLRMMGDGIFDPSALQSVGQPLIGSQPQSLAVLAADQAEGSVKQNFCEAQYHFPGYRTIRGRAPSCALTP